jgi:hypothetical protein
MITVRRCPKQSKEIHDLPFDKATTLGSRFNKSMVAALNYMPRGVDYRLPGMAFFTRLNWRRNSEHQQRCHTG